MATLKFTIVGRYEAEEEFYPEADGDASRMAELDQAQVDDRDVSLVDLIEWANESDITVKIEPE